MDLKVLAECKRDYWLVTCLDLNICAQGATPEAACRDLLDAVEGHLKVVIETDDVLSIPVLLHRPAPFSKYIKYYLAKVIGIFNQWKAMPPPSYFSPRHA